MRKETMMSLTMKPKQVLTKQLALDYKRAARRGKDSRRLIGEGKGVQPLLPYHGAAEANP